MTGAAKAFRKHIVRIMKDEGYSLFVGDKLADLGLSWQLGAFRPTHEVQPHPAQEQSISTRGFLTFPIHAIGLARS